MGKFFCLIGFVFEVFDKGVGIGWSGVVLVFWLVDFYVLLFVGVLWVL